jgi:hypothetical protein
MRIEDKVWNAFYNLQFIGIIWQGTVLTGKFGNCAGEISKI